MAVHTRKFPSEEDYEDWLSRFGARVHVLTIKSAEAAPTRSGMHGKRQVMVTYRTSDRALMPKRGKWLLGLEAILIVGALTLLGAYIAGALTPHSEQVLFRLK